jgi:hypothetical protein
MLHQAPSWFKWRDIIFPGRGGEEGRKENDKIAGLHKISLKIVSSSTSANVGKIKLISKPREITDLRYF